VTDGEHVQTESLSEIGIGFVLHSVTFMATTGLILFAHGSRIESANEGVRDIAARLSRAAAVEHVLPAFLELGHPDLAGAAATLAKQGVARIVIIPYFLTLGLHLERDLPQLVEALRAAHPTIDIRVTPPLEGHLGLLDILLDRWKQTI
jgi:sirohydrochlorin ferrochelatase